MLRTDYQDDILDPLLTARKYQMTENQDETVSFTDVSTYQQVGDTFGAADLNATNTAVNKCVEYVTGTLAANATTLNLTDDMFFADGHLEVYVPGDKVQQLVVASATVSDGSATITFSSSVATATRVDVYCK